MTQVLHPESDIGPFKCPRCDHFTTRETGPCERCVPRRRHAEEFRIARDHLLSAAAILGSVGWELSDEQPGFSITLTVERDRIRSCAREVDRWVDNP